MEAVVALALGNTPTDKPGAVPLTVLVVTVESAFAPSIPPLVPVLSLSLGIPLVVATV